MVLDIFSFVIEFESATAVSIRVAIPKLVLEAITLVIIFLDASSAAVVAMFFCPI